MVMAFLRRVVHEMWNTGPSFRDVRRLRFGDRRSRTPRPPGQLLHQPDAGILRARGSTGGDRTAIGKRSHRHGFSDPAPVIAAAGQVTSEIDLVISAYDTVRRGPAVLAQTLLTLDHAIRGRVVMALGAGEVKQLSGYGYSRKGALPNTPTACSVCERCWILAVHPSTSRVNTGASMAAGCPSVRSDNVLRQSGPHRVLRGT